MHLHAVAVTVGGLALLTPPCLVQSWPWEEKVGAAGCAAANPDAAGFGPFVAAASRKGLIVQRKLHRGSSFTKEGTRCKAKVTKAFFSTTFNHRPSPMAP